MSIIHTKHLPIRIPILIFCILIGLELLAVWFLNDGHVIYTVDDAYIHLALSENLRRGHYGINLGEMSAPSSSIIWPFILAPFTGLPGSVYIPLIINIVISLITVIFYGQICGIVLSSSDNPDQDTGIFRAAVLVLIFATNLIGLIFTGMEHSLQVFLVVMIMVGLIDELKTHTVSRGLLGAIVLGPLVRYENLAISFPILLYLLLRGHPGISIITGLALSLLVGGFSLFLYFHNLWVLPTSVIVKSFIGGRTTFLENFQTNFYSREGALLSVGLLLLIVVALSSKRETAERVLATCGALSILLHLFFGSFGMHQRYEIYIWAFALLLLLYLYRDVLRQISTERFSFPVYFLLAFVIITCPNYVGAVFDLPIASNNIYEQHYQMHRFVADYYKAPIAVNDLGFVSYQHDYYILDLVGLSSMELLLVRQNPGTAWMNDFARRHNVRMAMIYENWFNQLPDNWVPIGDLHLGKGRISAGEDRVTFYAFDQETFQHARRLLHEFQKTLPPGVEFQFREK